MFGKRDSRFGGSFWGGRIRSPGSLRSAAKVRSFYGIKNEFDFWLREFSRFYEERRSYEANSVIGWVVRWKVEIHQQI